MKQGKLHKKIYMTLLVESHVDFFVDVLFDP